MKINKYMHCLAIEMTRRCNMNCKFCSKGQSQNIDINEKIIDKTLDEMKDVYIGTLRISGGEPLLVPDLICYLIDKIIEKHILINDICIFTNGTVVPNLKLIESILRLLKYLRNTEAEIQDLIKWSNNNSQKVYDGLNDSRFDIIISDVEKNVNQSIIDTTLNFYKEHINDKLFNIVKQSKSFDDLGTITLEGNAKKNYKDFLTNKVSLSDIRILNNNYYFIDENNFIRKTLTISANGNVFAGCLMSYINVDNNPMFNIMECKKDFYKRVNEFCWEHPINEKALNIRNMFSAIEFCKKHNILVKEMRKNDYKRVKILNELVNIYETIAKDAHLVLPNLNFPEIDLLASTTLVLNMFNDDFPIDAIKLYLKKCTDLDNNTINSISVEYCKRLILFLSEKNNKTT